MLIRIVVFKAVLAILVFGSAFGLAIWRGVDESLNGKPAQSAEGSAVVRTFRRYPLPLGLGCAAVAAAAAFGDLLFSARGKGSLPTYSDEEFLAKFGGNPDAKTQSP